MSVFPQSIYGVTGYGLGWGLGYGGSVAQVATAPADPDAKAKPAEPIDRDGVASGIPWGLDYADMPAWSPGQAWEMLQYSAVSLCIQAICGPIYAGQRAIEIVKPDGTPTKKRSGGPLAGDGPTVAPEDEAKDAYERLLSPLWPDVLSALCSLWFGYWPQEVRYDRRDSLTVPCAFDDFALGDLLGGRVRVEQHNGRFNRLLYAGGPKGEQPLSRPHVFYSVCNPHLDPLFGVPRTYFAREPWWRAKESEKNGDRLQRKASGINLLLHLFSDSLQTGGDGKLTAGQQQLINALVSGGVGVTSRSMFDRATIKTAPQLADIAHTKVDQFDWGSTGPDLMAQISRLDAQDKRIARGIGVPERALMEAAVGGLGQGDSKEHGQQVADASDQEHKRTLREFNGQVFDPTLVTNHGPSWRGRLRWVAVPVDPASEAAKDALLQGIVPGLNPSPVDVPELMKQRKVPMVQGWEQPTEAPPDPNAPAVDAPQGDPNAYDALSDEERAVAESIAPPQVA